MCNISKRNIKFSTCHELVVTFGKGVNLIYVKAIAH